MLRFSDGRHICFLFKATRNVSIEAFKSSTLRITPRRIAFLMGIELMQMLHKGHSDERGPESESRCNRTPPANSLFRPHPVPGRGGLCSCSWQLRQDSTGGRD